MHGAYLSLQGDCFSRLLFPLLTFPLSNIPANDLHWAAPPLCLVILLSGNNIISRKGEMYLTPHEVCENCIFEFESYNTSCYNNTNICTCFIKYPFNLILRFPVMSYGFYYFDNAIIIQKIS